MLQDLKILGAILVLGLLSSCSNDPVLPVGFIGGLTGRFADLGSSGRNGAIVAVDWRNARGGINGRPVRLLIRDDEHHPDKARAALKSLIADQVLGVVGPMTSAMASEIVPLANETKTLLIGGTIVTSQLSGKDDYLLRVISDAQVYATQTAKHLQHSAPGARAVVVYDLANRDYSEDWAKNYLAETIRLGKPETTLHPFDSRIDDSASKVMRSIFAPGKQLPQLMVLVCSSRDAVAFAGAARRAAPQIQLAAAAWAATEQLLETGRGAIEGLIVQQYYNVDESGESFRSFSGEYSQRFGRKSDYAAVIAFDAMNVLLDGLEKHPERVGLRESILARRQFSGLNGLITFDASGDAQRPYFVASVKNNRYVAAATSLAP